MPRRALADDARRAKLRIPGALGPLERDELERMSAAGDALFAGYRALAARDEHLVDGLLGGAPRFEQLRPYPQDAVYDATSRASYYYHCHDRGEHGHFHAYLHVGEHADLPPPLSPSRTKTGRDVCAHLFAVSVDAYGIPTRLFVINRWASDEAWYDAATVRSLLDRFTLGAAEPALPTNGWLEAVATLFRPQIERLIDARDGVVEQWRRTHPECDPLEDQRLEVVAETPISVDRQIELVRTRLRARGRLSSSSQPNRPLQP